MHVEKSKDLLSSSVSVCELIVHCPCVQTTVESLDSFHAYQSLLGKVLMNQSSQNECLSLFFLSVCVLYDRALSHKGRLRTSGLNKSCPLKF